MSPEEANKIIAEFMEIIWSFRGDRMYSHELDSCGLEIEKYTDSLNALIPVWEKLRCEELKFIYEPYDQIGWFLDIDGTIDKRNDGTDIHLSITEAAAIATAKAILELDKSEKT